ncbi:hypothetical protein KC332_g15118 [Hortaea werneckii]|uniref:Uncharacterized protein n=2 Tax=Hortaea werneckii TaxID=91943 RepID=A0A3M7GUF5_HORWE|nr:hypothetical protein KC358_g14476 [Hortaea werneckii]OTA37738.1 hypothetical protein BTJ68_02507 [Hortaea werneckii EXF-2000]KAI6811316.1 hypothetical protein KC350_g12264 [Hortaea werneckii]KAI6917414.1 hypothetical protein KC348_g11199 [Hortaea werneckii]KAI6919405.1 hypothetical protein KC341_g17321 [Hortaea werneckii]
MRGSTVLQGFKDWASKFHPQLPLTQRESNRLLTALTTSFRSHLDKAHPRAAEEPSKLKDSGNGQVPRTSSHAIHSSAAFADKHLSSVLTDLAGPSRRKPATTVSKVDQDFANAQMELQKNPATDPVQLLEDYEKDGNASVAIARLCLEQCEKSLEGLAQDQKAHQIQQTQAGRRVLLWLWETGRYQQPEFVDDRVFIDKLVPFLLKEGWESYLWEWIELDQTLAEGDNEYSGVKKMYHRYRWKGRLLRAMVVHKLEDVGRADQSADKALDTFFKAAELKLSSREPYLHFLPLGHAGSALGRALMIGTDWNLRTDPVRYDRFTQCAKLFNQKGSPHGVRNSAQLWLHHPRNPDGRPMYEFYQKLFNNDSPVWQSIGDHVRKPKRREIGLAWYHQMTQTMAILRRQGLDEEAEWVKVRALENSEFASAKSVEKDVRRWQGVYDERDNFKAPAKTPSDEVTTENTPFPTFSGAV